MSATPNLAFYRRRAKQLLKLAAAGDAAALQRFAAHHPHGATLSPETLALHDAQLVIARENGFPSWRRLKVYVDSLQPLREQPPAERVQRLVRARDLAALERLLADDPKAVHLRIEPLGFTALHVAVAGGWLEGAERLLSAGADLDAVAEKTGATPLRVAIGYGHPALALWLLERGADPRAAETEEKTTMQAAAYADSKDVIRALVARGEAVDVFGAVALEDAALVRSLTATDPTVLARRMRSFQQVTITPLHLAALQNSAPMIDLLLELGAARDDRDEQGRTAIDLALHAGKRRACERLLAHGAVPDAELLRLVGTAERAERIARLHQALVDGDCDRTASELDADATLINQRLPDVWGTGGTFGASPLHWAAMFGHIELARLLLARGADLALRDLTYGGTPANWANEYRRHEMCAFLEALEKKP